MSIMGFLNDLLAKGQAVLRNYSGDNAFLQAASSAAANVIMADGKIEDAEVDVAISSMQANPILKNSYSPAKLEEELTAAINRAKTRAGRMENRRFLEALTVKPAEMKQDIFLIAADIADHGGIGPEEDAALGEIAKSLGVDKAKLLG